MIPEVRTRQVLEMKITPELAHQLLSTNYEFQRIRKDQRVRAMALDMKEGRWNEEIWQPIRFTKDGVLIDGQHRLSAVIESGCSIWMGVQNDLSIKDFEFIDLGAKRTAADFMRDEKNAKILAAVSRMTYATAHGRASITSVLHGYISTSPKTIVSDPCVMDESKRAEVKTACNEGCSIRRVMKCGAASIFGYGIWLLRWANETNLPGKSASDYVADWVSITPSQSTAVVKEWMRNSILSGRKVSLEDQLTLFLYGYDAFSENKMIKIYQPKNGALKKYEALIGLKRSMEVNK